MRPPHFFLCVDFYSWVGEKDGYDGCVAFISHQMQRGLATLQRERGWDDKERKENNKEIVQEESHYAGKKTSDL